MPIVKTRITLLDAPNGHEQDVVVKRKAPVKILETKDVDGPGGKQTWTRIQLLRGGATGWVLASAIDADATPDPTIVASDFARQCWWVSLQYSGNPYYLAAVAQLRSKLSNDHDQSGIGPFRILPAEWDAYRADPQIGLSAFTAEDISDWYRQCTMYGILTQNAGDAVAGLLGRQPTWIELYLSQMTGPKPASTIINNPGDAVDNAFTSLKPSDFSVAGLSADQTLNRYSSSFRDNGTPPRVLTGSQALDLIEKSLQASLEFVQKTVDDVAKEFIDAENPPDGATAPDPKSAVQGPQKGGPTPKFKTKLAQNEWEAYHAALDAGLRDVAARALVANMMGESLARPNDHHMDVDKFGRPAHMAQGIVQWDPDRSAAIAKKFGKEPKDMTVAEQTTAAIWEIRTVRRFAKSQKAIETGKTAEEIIAVLVPNYEAPADSPGQIRKRIGFLPSLSQVLSQTA
jgi:hypothetical protein